MTTAVTRWSFLSTTFSAHTTDQASSSHVELVRKVTVWYWAHLNASDVPINSHLVLLASQFSLIGVALIFLLLVGKLTLATGTLSGLV